MQIIQIPTGHRQLSASLSGRTRPRLRQQLSAPALCQRRVQVAAVGRLSAAELLPAPQGRASVAGSSGQGECSPQGYLIQALLGREP